MAAAAGAHYEGVVAERDALNKAIRDRAAAGLAKMAPRRRQDERAGFRVGADAPRRDGDDARESRRPGACGQDWVGARG